jgi:hypothetical protein
MNFEAGANGGALGAKIGASLSRIILVRRDQPPEFSFINVPVY